MLALPYLRGQQLVIFVRSIEALQPATPYAETKTSFGTVARRLGSSSHWHPTSQLTAIAKVGEQMPSGHGETASILITICSPVAEIDSPHMADTLNRTLLTHSHSLRRRLSVIQSMQQLASHFLSPGPTPPHKSTWHCPSPRPPPVSHS